MTTANVSRVAATRAMTTSTTSTRRVVKSKSIARTAVPTTTDARGRAHRRAGAIALGGFEDLPMSGLEGQALAFPHKDDFPSRAAVLSNIPDECFKKDTAKSLMYAAVSTAMTVGCGLIAAATLPLQAAWWPAWLAYAAVNGTIATGCWVIAHECGHNAFSDNRSHSRRGRVRVALGAPRAVLFLAALARRAPLTNEPLDGRRNARAVRQGRIEG